MRGLYAVNTAAQPLTAHVWTCSQKELELQAMWPSQDPETAPAPAQSPSQQNGTTASHSQPTPEHRETAEKGRDKCQAEVLSQLLRDLKLDDWEIRPAELEWETQEDGSPVLLGKGAFGQVRAGAGAQTR